MDERTESEAGKPDLKGGHPFYPVHVLKDAIILYFLIGVVLTLSILLPLQLHEKADPLVTPQGLKPEWYFLPMYQAVKYFPELIGLMIQGLILLTLLIWPFIDHAITHRVRAARAFRWVGLVALVGALLAGFLGWASGKQFTWAGQRYEVSHKGLPHRVPAAAPKVGTPSGIQPAGEEKK